MASDVAQGKSSKNRTKLGILPSRAAKKPASATFYTILTLYIIRLNYVRDRNFIKHRNINCNWN
jgi:hypothetical protein